MVLGIISDGYCLAKGAFELGRGVYAYLQDEASLSEILEDMTVDTGDVNQRVKAVQKDITTMLVNQSSLVALFKQESADTHSRLDSLSIQVAQGFDNITSTIDNAKAIENARDFKCRLEAVSMEYDELVDYIVAYKNANQQCSILCKSPAQRKAENVERRAIDLYAWAKSFVPYPDGQGASGQARVLSKQEKLEIMPYITAMAYALRVKMDACMVKSHGMSDQGDRERYLTTCCRSINHFIELLHWAVIATVRNTSLLEMALDFDIPVTTYVMLIRSLRASVQMTIEPSTVTQEKIPAWKDGLSGIRSLFCRGARGIDTAKLDNTHRQYWWLYFVNMPHGRSGPDAIRTTVTVRDICLILGAARRDDGGLERGIELLRLVPGYEPFLFSLSPARSMRETLINSLATALHIPSAALQSAACIRKLSDLPPPTDRRTAQPVPRSPPPQLVRTFSGHSSTVNCVAVSSDNQHIVSASADTTVNVWRGTTGEKLRTLKKRTVKKSTDSVLCVAIFADSKRAVTGHYADENDSALQTWSLESGKRLKKLAERTHAVFGVAVSPGDCTIASASIDGTVKLWNVCSGKCDVTLVKYGSAVKCVAFSANGQVLASGSSDNTIKVWCVHTHSLLRTIACGHTSHVSGLAFHGDVLVSCSLDTTVRVCKWKSGELQSALKGHASHVRCVAVFPGGQRVATGSDDKTVKIWNLRTGECEYTLKDHASKVSSVAVSHDGRALVSASHDRTIKVWTV